MPHWIRLGLLACLLLSACERRAVPPEFAGRGAYTHEATGLVFPPEVVGFHRTEVVRPDHDQVFVGYEFPRGTPEVVLTVALSPAAGGCEGAFADRKRATAAVNPGLRWLWEHPVALPRDDAVPGRMAAFHFDLRGAPMRGEIWVFCPVAADWELSYRVSMPREVRADERLAAFMAETPAPAPP